MIFLVRISPNWQAIHIWFQSCLIPLSMVDSESARHQLSPNIWFVGSVMSSKKKSAIFYRCMVPSDSLHSLPQVQRCPYSVLPLPIVLSALLHMFGQKMCADQNTRTWWHRQPYCTRGTWGYVRTGRVMKSSVIWIFVRRSKMRLFHCVGVAAMASLSFTSNLRGANVIYINVVLIFIVCCQWKGSTRLSRSLRWQLKAHCHSAGFQCYFTHRAEQKSTRMLAASSAPTLTETYLIVQERNKGGWLVLWHTGWCTSM